MQGCLLLVGMHEFSMSPRTQQEQSDNMIAYTIIVSNTMSALKAYSLKATWSSKVELAFSFIPVGKASCEGPVDALSLFLRIFDLFGESLAYSQLLPSRTIFGSNLISFLSQRFDALSTCFVQRPLY